MQFLSKEPKNIIGKTEGLLSKKKIEYSLADLLLTKTPLLKSAEFLIKEVRFFFGCACRLSLNSTVWKGPLHLITAVFKYASQILNLENQNKIWFYAQLSIVCFLIMIKIPLLWIPFFYFKQIIDIEKIIVDIPSILVNTGNCLICDEIIFL